MIPLVRQLVLAARARLAELEAEAARQRAKKHEDRRARIADLRKKYLDDELRMDGDKQGE